MTKEEIRLECLKLAVSKATPASVGAGCVEIAQVYEKYVVTRKKPAPVANNNDKTL